MGRVGEGLVRKMIWRGGRGVALGWKGKPDSMNLPTLLSLDDILSDWLLSTPEDVQVFVGDWHSLASQHVFSSAAYRFCWLLTFFRPAAGGGRRAARAVNSLVLVGSLILI